MPIFISSNQEEKVIVICTTFKSFARKKQKRLKNKHASTAACAMIHCGLLNHTPFVSFSALETTPDFSFKHGSLLKQYKHFLTKFRHRNTCDGEGHKRPMQISGQSRAESACIQQPCQPLCIPQIACGRDKRGVPGGSAKVSVQGLKRPLLYSLFS